MHNVVEHRRRAFDLWLRTGRLPFAVDGSGLEFKFNPWHDPLNGRFTFVGAGRYYGRGGVPRNKRDQDTPRVEFIDDPTKPPVASIEEAEAWAAAQLAEHRDTPGYREAIAARLKLYRDAFAAGPNDPIRQIADFASGAGEAVSDIAKGAANGLYSLLTTNPITTVRDIGIGIAEKIDAAIAAEDTPAYVHFDYAQRSIANASAHDIGYAVGTIAGNVGLAVAPATAVAKISAVRKAGGIRAGLVTKNPLQIGWVDENVGLKGLVKEYNDSAMGARSNVLTRRGQAPALKRLMPDDTTRLVKFDGVDGRTLVDRKRSIYTTRKAKDQALRQSEALAQNGVIGRWEVPNRAEQNRAVKMLGNLNIQNIEVRIIEP